MINLSTPTINRKNKLLEMLKLKLGAYASLTKAASTDDYDSSKQPGKSANDNEEEFKIE